MKYYHKYHQIIIIIIIIIIICRDTHQQKDYLIVFPHFTW